MEQQSCGLWVFGYGSLCWNPGFEFKRSIIGYVEGFSRKFWQGNATHRGTLQKPGRVVTLIENKEEITYGRAFEIKDSAALPYLEKRECALGGYKTTISKFYSQDGKTVLPVVIYIATSENEHWLGDAPLPSIAKQILECQGPSGHNVEYLLRLADFMHQHCGEAKDDHLFALETLVRVAIKEQQLCEAMFMGNRQFFIKLDSAPCDGVADNIQNNIPSGHQHISRVPKKQLRCLKP